MVANIDRFVINVMIESIKRDLGVSDTQISLLVGFSFSLFYVVCGFWIARMADRGSRKVILTIGAVIWSIMTSFSGMAQNFTQLFLARIGIGVGEASIAPCAQSMIADAVPKRAMSRAFSIFNIGALFGTLLALVLGGSLVGWAARSFPEGVILPIIGHIFSWQLVFFIVGLPGIALALLFFFTVGEPKRAGDGAAGAMRLGELFDYMRSHRRVYVGIYGGITIGNLGAAAVVTWLPALLQRKYGVMPDQLGLFMLFAFALPGIVATLLAGLVGDRLMKRGYQDAYLRVASFVCLLGFIPFGLASLMPTVVGLAAVAAVGTVTSYMSVPLSMTALQAVSLPRMRATVASLYSIAVLILGYGLGPLLVALLNDYVFQDPSKLDVSMAIVVTSAFLAAGVLYGSARRDFGALMGSVDEAGAGANRPAGAGVSRKSDLADPSPA